MATGPPPPELVAAQMAKKEEFSATGLTAFLIAGISICAVSVALRFWARKRAKLGLRSDDWTLLVALLETIGWATSNAYSVYHGGFGRHTYTISTKQANTQGANALACDLLYTTGYPLARISLVLLYRRIFITKWFRVGCWIMIGFFASYAIATVIVDLYAQSPIESNWNKEVPVTRMINKEKLYIANCGFNIATDAVLLVMPLTIIWTLNMTVLHKIGVSAIFGLGVLTLLASIFRLTYYYKLDFNDFLFSATKVSFWTAAELYLGIICPCLVTFRPIIHSGYLIFSRNLSDKYRGRLSKLTGQDVSPDRVNGIKAGKASPSDDGMQRDPFSITPSLRSKPSDYESQLYPLQEEPKHTHPLPQQSSIVGRRYENGMAVNQEAALAGLDPRPKSIGVSGQKQGFGTSSEAVSGVDAITPPEDGIKVKKGYKLEEAKGVAL